MLCDCGQPSCFLPACASLYIKHSSTVVFKSLTASDQLGSSHRHTHLSATPVWTAAARFLSSFSVVDWALKFTNVVIRPDYRLYVCESLLDEAKAVDNFVQTEVTVLPGVHGGVFSLEQRREKGGKIQIGEFLNRPSKIKMTFDLLRMPRF